MVVSVYIHVQTYVIVSYNYTTSKRDCTYILLYIFIYDELFSIRACASMEFETFEYATLVHRSQTNDEDGGT